MRFGWLLTVVLLLVACQSGVQGPATPAGHLRQSPAVPTAHTSPPALSSAKTPPRIMTAPRRYNVRVRNVPVGDILFALAQEEKLDLEIAPEVDERRSVTLTATQQDAPALFRRLARLANARLELADGQLRFLPDAPFVRHYRIDYPNLSRAMRGAVATSTQIASGEHYGEGTRSALEGDNVSSARVENSSQNEFWGTLEHNIRDLIREPGQSAEEAALNVMAHAETGLLGVRAGLLQHEKIAAWLGAVADAARRQVLIEATIVEVELSDAWRQGIEWRRIWDDGNKYFSVTPAPMRNSDGSLAQPFVLSFQNLANPLSATLELLSAFGSTKVLSSPRLAVLNNQTALLKVVENVVYFNIKAEVAAGNANSNPLVAYTSTPQTVSVGLAMAVTPQIGKDGQVILNVRPTLSSIAGMVKDPNPDIPPHVANEIPQIRTREIESVLRLKSGQIGVLGGLMEDRLSKADSRVPLLGQMPLLGTLFSARNDAYKKSELVIFLRPIILADDDTFQEGLPDDDFWRDAPGRPGA